MPRAKQFVEWINQEAEERNSPFVGMNPLVYVPIFDKTIKNLEEKGRTIDASTVLLKTGQRLFNQYNARKDQNPQKYDEQLIELNQTIAHLERIAKFLNENNLFLNNF